MAVGSWVVTLAASPWGMVAWLLIAIAYSVQTSIRRAASEKALEAMVTNVVRRQMGLPDDPRHPPAPPPGSATYRGERRSRK
jgi:hypothetical protein